MTEYDEIEKRMVLKLVYYGPALSGKTTNLLRLHDILAHEGRGDLMVLDTKDNRLLQQEKMASVGQLAAGVAHEINNPMGFITSNINTLKNYIYIERFKEMLHLYRTAFEGKDATDDIRKVAQKKWNDLKLDLIFSSVPTVDHSNKTSAKTVRCPLKKTGASALFVEVQN